MGGCHQRARLVLREAFVDDRAASKREDDSLSPTRLGAVKHRFNQKFAAICCENGTQTSTYNHAPRPGPAYLGLFSSNCII